VIALGAPAVLAISAVVIASVWRGASPDVTATEVARPTVAVLPFENLGPAVDEYFADGVADELTTRLGEVRQLRVISRTSTRAYKGTSRALREVGRELGADYILEGTVRWERLGTEGGRVRVRPRLVKVSDDSQVWAEAFDADLDDVFTLEGTIGERVAAALAVAIGGTEQAALHQRPTSDIEAYNYFLRGEAFRLVRDSVGAWRTAIAFYDSALTLDPTFALALARRSELQSKAYWGNYDAISTMLDRAREDAEAAVALAPTLPEARLALAIYYYRGRREYARALSELSIGLARQPDNADLLFMRGAILRRTGRFQEAAQDFALAAVLDPRSPFAALETAFTYMWLDRFAEAEVYATRAIAIHSAFPEAHAMRAFLELNWRGDVEAARRLVREALRVVDIESFMGRLRFQAPWLVPQVESVDSIVVRLTAENFGATPADYLLWMANWHRQRGSLARGREYADSARRSLERAVADASENPEAFSSLAMANAFLGRKEEALRFAARAAALLPLEVDAVVGFQILTEQAWVSALVGEHEASLEILERLLSVPNELSVPFIAVDPMWSSLRGHPRFERLLGSHR
jgi:serine/threonine-protein kinase